MISPEPELPNSPDRRLREFLILSGDRIPGRSGTLGLGSAVSIGDDDAAVACISFPSADVATVPLAAVQSHAHRTMWQLDVLDEVALEGLDGVTPDTLWTRLEKRSGFPLNVRDGRVRDYLWRAVICNPAVSSLSFFSLPADRPPLLWSDRFQNVSATGLFLDDDEQAAGDNAQSCVSGRPVRGSCKDIDVRQDVTAEVYADRSSLSDVMRQYGSKLVIVASQEDRNKALGLCEVDPFMFLSDKIYCFLELIGCRREQGLATIGADAAIIAVDSKTAFYYRKQLLKKHLISKNHFHMVSKGKSHVVKGSLIFLSRFHRKIYSPIEQAAVKVSNLLLSEPDQECDYVVLRENIDQTSRKMFSYVFANFAPNFDCFMKDAKQGDSVVKRKVVRLVKPVDLDAEDKDENDGEEDGDDDEAEDGADVCEESLEKARLFDPTRILADRSLLSQVLMAIERSETGLSLVEIGAQLSLTKLDARLLTKLLTKCGKVKFVKEEMGRTRASRYCSVSKLDHADNVVENARNGLQLQKSLETILKLERANMILDTLELAESNIVFGVYYFVKEIRRKEGPGKICDPKSVRRLLNMLEENGRLRVHQFDSSAGDKEHSVQVITKPDVSIDDPFLKGKVESYFFRLNNKNTKEAEATRRAAVKQSVKKNPKSPLPEKVDEGVYVYNPSVGRKKYGCQAKMRKIFTLYKFLFQQLHVVAVRREQSASYGDWRDHIVPLPHKNNRVPIRDLVPRFPVYIFCRVVNVMYEIPGLVQLLQDPAKQNVPLNQASDVITKGLLFARKYVYNILSLMTFLVGMGLAELGNADAPDKDEVTVKILNKFSFTHTGVTDNYTFNSVEDIEKCEEEMAMHCQSPCSGCSLSANLFAHQTRNWYDGPRIKPIHVFPFHIPPDSSMQITLLPAPEPVDPDSADEVPNSSRKRGQKRGSQQPSSVTPRKRMRSATTTASSEVTSESVTPRKRRPAMDDKDKHALTILNRRRCIWSQQEDNFLLLCRVATLLLSQESIMYINARLVRDEMHRVIPHSQNKTTNACRRRILYMLKDNRTRQNVLDWVSEFRQDDAFAEIDVPVVPKTNEQVWNDVFMDTMTKVLNKFASPRDEQSVAPLLQMNEQSLQAYDLVNYLGSSGMTRMPVFMDPKNCVDIYVNAVENVLISSLIMSHEGTRKEEKYSYALFKIYQRYPDSLIRSVVTKFKKNNIMAMNKKNNAQEHSMLKNRGVTPYKLSQHYSFLLQTKFAMDSLIRPIDLTVPFHDSEERCDACAVVSLLTSRSAKFTVSIPEDFIALDKDNPFAKSCNRLPGDILMSGDKRCSSRSVLYAFREQLSLNTKQPRDKIQDYLVLNKCTVSVESTIRNPLSHLFASATQTLFSKPVFTPIPDQVRDELDQLIQSRKELGCTRQEIESSFGVFPHRSLTEMVHAKVVYRVGVNTFRWVHRNFLAPWIVRSASRISSAVSDANERRQRRESQHDIEYIAKVWRRPSGDPDTSILYKLMAAIVGHVMTYPGISQDAILSHFHITAPATQLLEMIELLISGGCISMVIISSRPKTRLFSSVSSCSLFEADDSHRLDDDASSIRAAERFFEVTPNGILILSQVREELAQSGARVGGDVSEAQA